MLVTGSGRVKSGQVRTGQVRPVGSGRGRKSSGEWQHRRSACAGSKIKLGACCLVLGFGGCELSCLVDAGADGD
jgi:hypothetical protein